MISFPLTNDIPALSQEDFEPPTYPKYNGERQKLRFYLILLGFVSRLIISSTITIFKQYTTWKVPPMLERSGNVSS
jgi:hypothetical protein